MKQTRRKELKTNELSIYLQQMYESIQRNTTYLLGGIVVVVIVLVIGFYVQHRRHKTMAEAWTKYYDIREQDVTKKPETLDQARELANQYGDNAQLGAAVLQLKGDLAYELSLSLIKPEEETRRLELLEEAKATFEELLDRSDSDAQAAARAHIGLAKIEESLVSLGKGNIEAVRKHYQTLVDKKPNPFAASSEKRLAELDQRLTPLNIVATRPAEPPATAPAITTAPAAVIATQPEGAVIAPPIEPLPALPADVPAPPSTTTTAPN